MNLLKVQDALKNASDQQLMALMQAPDSTAPSYLVLSEIRRRKDMRSKQAPEGSPNRTVAEELTAPEAPAGIRGLQPQMDPDGVDAAEGGDVQGMAAGGIVRMQAGGATLFSPLIPMGEDLERDLLERANRARREDEARMGASAAQSQSRVIGDAMADVRAQIEGGVSPQEAINSTLNAPSYRGRVTREQLPLALFNPAGLPPSPPIPPAPTRLPFEGERFPEDVPARLPPLTEPAGTQRTEGQPGRPEERPTTQPAVAPGIEGLRNTPTGIPEGGQLPTMADLMRQNAALFPDGLGSIRDRMREERVDPAARRSEAVNMALIEAGLRIAGSRNPSLIGAIGEGALPAVQSYSQQLGQIRGEQRQARQDELELAKQDTNRQFAIGQISAAEYRSRMDNINANLRANAQERGANARLAASEAAAERRAATAATAAEEADLRRGYASPERLARMTPEERAAFERIRTIGRPLDTSGASSALNATLQDINRIATQIDTLGPRPTRNFADWDRNNASLQQRLRDAEARRRQLEDIVVYGRPRDGVGGSTNLPSGGRIENGRYIPAGS
jgi:hypothetical protein